MRVEGSGPIGTARREVHALDSALAIREDYAPACVRSSVGERGGERKTRVIVHSSHRLDLELSSSRAYCPEMSAQLSTDAQVNSQVPSATRADRLMSSFSAFRTELDQHQAQRERIVKLSRDVTALSKQLIFALHRIASGKGIQTVVREAEGKMKDLRVLFAKLQGEVQGADFWR